MGNIITSKIFHSVMLFTVVGEFFLPWILCRYYDGYNSKTMAMSIVKAISLLRIDNSSIPDCNSKTSNVFCGNFLLRKKTFQSYRFYCCFHWGHLLSEQDWFREYMKIMRFFKQRSFCSHCKGNITATN